MWPDCRVAAGCHALSMIRLRQLVVPGRCHVPGHIAVLGLPVTADDTLPCHEYCHTPGDRAAHGIMMQTLLSPATHAQHRLQVPHDKPGRWAQRVLRSSNCSGSMG